MSGVPRLFEAYKREYNIWAMMKQRCRNPKAANYVNYGGVGVTVGPDFERFSDFLHHMGPAPSLKHTLDRIDNSGGYTAANCRWADVHTQQNNRTNGVHFLFRGQELSVPQIARLTGVTEHNLAHRIKHMGMPVEEAVACQKMSWRQRPVRREPLDGSEPRTYDSVAAAAKEICAQTPGLSVEKARKQLWATLKKTGACTGWGAHWEYVE